MMTYVIITLSKNWGSPKHILKNPAMSALKKLQAKPAESAWLWGTDFLAGLVTLASSPCTSGAGRGKIRRRGGTVFLLFLCTVRSFQICLPYIVYDSICMLLYVTVCICIFSAKDHIENQHAIGI